MVVRVTRVRVPQFPLCDQNRNICLVRVHMGRERRRRRLVQRELFHLVLVSSSSLLEIQYETKSGASYPNVVASCHSYINPAAEPCVRVQYSTVAAGAVPHSLGSLDPWLSIRGGCVGLVARGKVEESRARLGVRAGKLRRVASI
jgi:hypothetical protein